MSKRTSKGGYYRGDKFIEFTWGDKISAAQQQESYKKQRRRSFVCGGCGKNKIGSINQIYCDYQCKYKSLSKDPIAKKAYTMSSPIAFGKGKKVYFEKLLNDSLGEPCRYCRSILSLDSVSLDHIVPFGETKLRNNKLVAKKLNVPENLQIICKRCNQMKGTLSHDKFVKLLDFMASDIEIKDYLTRKLAQSNIMWSFKRKSR